MKYFIAGRWNDIILAILVIVCIVLMLHHANLSLQCSRANDALIQQIVDIANGIKG